MDAPAMFARKQIPEDVGVRNTGEDGGQGQLHREEKEHKPVLKKVKEKVKKIKHTLTGHSHGHGDEHGQRDEPAYDDGGSSSDEEEAGDAALEREAAMEKGGYMEDVEDKPVAMEPEPEVHGAPMYESERLPAVQDLVAKYDPQARAPAAREAHGADAPGVRFGDLGRPVVHNPATQEVRHGADAPGVRFGDLGGAAALHDPAAREVPRDDSPKVRLGELGGPVVEDPAAPRSTTPAAREGEDIGATPVAREFESMILSDDPSHVGAAKQGAKAEEWKDAATDKLSGGASSGGLPTYTDKLKSAAAVPAEYGRKLASTVYEKVAGGGTTGTRDDEQIASEATPVSDAGAGVEDWKDAPEGVDANATTDRSSGPGYTDKIKSTAAGTTEYGKQLASAAYEKVAGIAPNLRPQVGVGKQQPEERRDDDETVVVSHVVASEEARKDAAAGTDATTGNTSAPGYTEKIKSAAAGTTEYGKQLATTVYEKVTGVGTTVASKVQQATQSAGTATPGVGAQQHQDSTNASPTVTPGREQDKGVGVTGYIAEKLRPGDEHRELSSAIAGAVQRRKEEVGGTVGQRVPAPSQVITMARETVTSLTGGNRVSETMQPNAATGVDVRENVGAEAPLLRGEEIGEPKLNTNTM